MALTGYSYVAVADVEDAKLVTIFTAKPVTIQKTINLIGTVKSANVAIVRAATTGIIEKIVVAEGSAVTKGTVLAQLKNSAVSYSATLELEQVQIAKTKYQKLKQHAGANIISKNDLAISKQQWLQAEINANSAKQTLNKTLFKAPFNGTCGVFKVAVGDVVKQNDAIVTIYNSTNKIVYIDIPDNILDKIAVDQKILVHNVPGKITAVQRVVDP
ncbi:MAG: hypothetical protein COC15_05205, partial [Legionellales bacterium]